MAPAIGLESGVWVVRSYDRAASAFLIAFPRMRDSTRFLIASGLIFFPVRRLFDSATAATALARFSGSAIRSCAILLRLADICALYSGSVHLSLFRFVVAALPLGFFLPRIGLFSPVWAALYSGFCHILRELSLARASQFFLALVAFIFSQISRGRFVPRSGDDIPLFGAIRPLILALCSSVLFYPFKEGHSDHRAPYL